MSKLRELKKKYDGKLEALRGLTGKRQREDMIMEIGELEKQIEKLEKEKRTEKEEGKENLKEVECDGCGKEFEFDVVCYPDIFANVDKELCISDKALFNLPYDGLNFQGVIKDGKVYCQACTEDRFEELPIRR